MKETHEEYVNRINNYTDEEIMELINNDKCPYEPERYTNVPIGMYHCPLCWEMVLAGMPHPRKSDSV